MTSAIPGAPIGPDIEPSRRQKTYDHVPALRELLTNGGWPGVTYAQVCVHNLKAASDRSERPANLRPIRGTSYYAIEGPRGVAAMALVGCGSPIPGAHPECGERLFFTDGELEAVTGLPVGEYPIWFSASPQHEVADAPIRPSPVSNTGASAVAVPEAPRQKRKYTRRMGRKRVRGRYTSAVGVNDGREKQPVAQATEGGEGHGGVPGGDAA